MEPEQLDDRAGPAVGHDQRQRVFVLGLDVDEVDVHAVDLGRELGQGIERGLERAPVVVGRPVARQLLDRRQLHALRPIGDELLAGQARRGEALAQVVEVGLRHLDVEGADVGGGGVLRGVAWVLAVVIVDSFVVMARAEPVMPRRAASIVMAALPSTRRRVEGQRLQHRQHGSPPFSAASGRWRGALPRAPAAAPRPRSARLSAAGCNESGWDRLARPSSAAPNRARRERR